MKNINLILATFFIVVCFASIICGRFATFHNTETEAFFIDGNTGLLLLLQE